MEVLSKMEYERNPCGIKVCKCCQSCEERKIRENGTRECRLTKQTVRVSKYLKRICDKWRMSETLMLAGKSRGGIKKKDYLDYVRNRILENGLNEENVDSKMIEEIRQEYRTLYGSIYYL